MGIIDISLFQVVIHMKTLLWCMECDVFANACNFKTMSIYLTIYDIK